MSSKICIGIMSGTSLDGADAVACAFEDDKIQFLGHSNLAFDASLKKDLEDLLKPGENEIERMGSVGIRLAHVYAEVTQKLLKTLQLTPNDIDAIGVHGQTIRHCPQEHFTVQLNNPALVAELTGIDVIADFRSRDMAAGGEGAPLVPAFHQAVFAGEAPRAIVNIGGIANVTALIPGHHVFGFDTGPGNTLMDFLAERLLNQRCDANGDTAARGEIKESIVNFYLEEPYFKLQPPKSTGRELFNQGFLNRCQRFTFLSPEDKLATITELTAISIIRGI